MDDGAAVARHQIAQGGVRESDRGHDVQAVHLLLGGERRFPEQAVGAEAGVVHQELQAGLGPHAVRHARQIRLGRQIGDEHLARGAVRPSELRGEGVQPVLPPGHQQQVMARRQGAGELRADPAGGSGDDDDCSAHGVNFRVA